MDWDGLKKDWRIWLWAIAMIVSVLLIINPTNPYVQGDDGQVHLNTNIKQGLDLQGGARVMIQPQGENVTDDTIQQIIDTLQTRISAFGLQEMDIRPVTVQGQRYVQIELAGANTQDLTELINRTGRFEARMPITVQDQRTIQLGSESYEATVQDSQVQIDGETYSVNDTFTLSAGQRDVQFTYTNNTENGAVLSALAFSGEDVLGVDINSRASGIQKQGDSYQFQFQVSVTDTAAQRVTDIAQTFPKGTRNLQGAQLVLFLDDSQISSLGIANSFQDSPVQQPVITGGAQTQEEAAKEMRELKSVLKSGALPVPIEIVSQNSVSATLGSQFLQTAIFAILVAIAAVALVIYLRYRDPGIVIPLTMTGFSELVMIFGFAAAVGWTIDLPSIAGIIAAIGTGVDDQIIITDERGRERLKSLKKRFKRAFFIIFTSAASTIGAMIPLTRIGAGTIEGFAVTTIIGVVIGVLITRPAYARVLQYMDQ